MGTGQSRVCPNPRKPFRDASGRFPARCLAPTLLAAARAKTHTPRRAHSQPQSRMPPEGPSPGFEPRGRPTSATPGRNSGPFGRRRPAAHPRSRTDPAHRPRQLRRGLARPQRPEHAARRQDRPPPDLLARSPLRTRVQGHPEVRTHLPLPRRTGGYPPGRPGRRILLLRDGTGRPSGDRRSEVRGQGAAPQPPNPNRRLPSSVLPPSLCELRRTGRPPTSPPTCPAP
jgi:hypothetical protein